MVERYIAFKTSDLIKERGQTSTEKGIGCQGIWVLASDQSSDRSHFDLPVQPIKSCRLR